MRADWLRGSEGRCFRAADWPRAGGAMGWVGALRRALLCGAAAAARGPVRSMVSAVRGRAAPRELRGFPGRRGRGGEAPRAEGTRRGRGGDAAAADRASRPQCAQADDWRSAKAIYDFHARDIDGNDVSLEKYRYVRPRGEACGLKAAAGRSIV